MFLASLIPLAKDSIKDSSLSVKLSMYFSICNRRVLFTKLLAGRGPERLRGICIDKK